ncbi:MAG TPA: hypothetical protein VGX92_17600 [Pyrinomonadaceae bacterium]|jgi:hypothetical protein|nr:hypothetical protein [Pyrinomonadaceae bacterium]
MRVSSPSVSLFAVSNPEGEALARAFVERARDAFNLNVRVYERATQSDLFRACLKDDIVIFDASVETGHNYAAATAQPMVLDHVLVASRTYLPLNFYGLREDGAPSYPQPLYRSNEELIEWLCKQVKELLQDAVQPNGNRGFINYFKLMRSSLKKQEGRWNQRGRIFISYRSRHLKAVERLKQRIENGEVQAVAHSSVNFLRPGELVFEDEVLTEFRHWQLASMIDRKIGAADEMWIYGTDDYMASWWTRAELVTVAYRRANNTRAPRVRLFDPSTDTLQDPPENLLPPINREEKRRMARWYANTDPGSMGPESLQPMRLYAQLPLIGRLKYFQDHVWSEEFWNEPLLACTECQKKAGPQLRIDLNAFLWLREPHLVRLTPAQLETSVQQGYVNCHRCGTLFEIKEAEHPRYFWMPVRYGKATGPDGQSLRVLPVFRASKLTPD